MRYQIICPDGIDRLKTNWSKFKDAEFDAMYFSRRSSCSDWCNAKDNEELGYCKGGIHTINNIKIKDEEISTVWTIDL